MFIGTRNVRKWTTFVAAMPKSPTPAELLSLSQANGIHRLYFPIDWSCLTFKPAFVAGLTLPLVQASADGPTAARILRCLGAETRGWQNASGKRASDSPLHQGAPLTSMQMSSTHLYTVFWTHPNYENDKAKQSQTAKMGQHGPKLSKHHNGQLTGAALCHCHQWSPRHRQCLPRPIGCAARCCASRDATRLWRIRSISRQQVHSNWDWYRII